MEIFYPNSSGIIDQAVIACDRYLKNAIAREKDEGWNFQFSIYKKAVKVLLQRRKWKGCRCTLAEKIWA